MKVVVALNPRANRKFVFATLPTCTLGEIELAVEGIGGDGNKYDVMDAAELQGLTDYDTAEAIEESPLVPGQTNNPTWGWVK